MTVHFIGAGPGAADLLTFRGASLIGASPVCLYAGTYVTDEMLAHCPDGVELVDTAVVNLDEQIAIMKRATAEGRDVARLCSGDPSIYSAVAEQTRRLDAEGIDWDVTPGVPAYAAAAALVGKELSVPEVAQTVILTRAQRASTKLPPEESLAELAKTHATLVLHLAIRFVRELQETLIPEYGADCPVVVVSRAEQPDELIIRGTLADVADTVEQHGLRQAAIIIVGWALDAEDFPDSHLYRTRHLP
ncbi:precorrin-4 C(11)-methyltransferase [Raineyella sp.]|uniref:Precorrin-4 C(11)-methyltransferase n=1 Tax=bioreactor metagenome TaxID=1076179 RepID=A0A644ZLR7_9ZZZZ|nr:precorrin-4 C(11)-methyltransferase [Raineyella sp.]MEA5154932.1 precorrin-4 C(11)-methyltransferase [Raineyella sp.]